MPASYQIDAARGVLLALATGRLTDEDLATLQHDFGADPAFRPDLCQLFDARGVTEMAITGATLRQLAMENPFGAGARRAILVGTPVAFGMARMYELLTDTPEHQVRVFEDEGEAWAWLERRGR